MVCLIFFSCEILLFYSHLDPTSGIIVSFSHLSGLHRHESERTATSGLDYTCETHFYGTHFTR
jgi:hypothetical protein